jgi:hypothetical protein
MTTPRVERSHWRLDIFARAAPRGLQLLRRPRTASNPDNIQRWAHLRMAQLFGYPQTPSVLHMIRSAHGTADATIASVLGPGTVVEQGSTRLL